MDRFTFLGMDFGRHDRAVKSVWSFDESGRPALVKCFELPPRSSRGWAKRVRRMKALRKRRQ